MKWAEELKKEGIGIIGTADSSGKVNLAIYSPPLVKNDGKTVVFGATHRITYQNLTQNPYAMFMYITGRWSGIRMALKLVKIEQEGRELEEIKERFVNMGYDKLAQEIRYALHFEVEAVYPLKGR